MLYGCVITVILYIDNLLENFYLVTYYLEKYLLIVKNIINITMRPIIFLSILITAVVAVFSSNCTSSSKNWYNVSVAPAENVTIDVYLLTAGHGKTVFMDSEENRINISIDYVNRPIFKQYRDNDNLSLYTAISYPGSASAGIGADMLIYIYRNATYSFNIFQNAGVNQAILNYSSSNVTIADDIDLTSGIHDKVFNSGFNYQDIPVICS